MSSRPDQNREQFNGKRLAVIGLGVSGIAMCEAAKAIGAIPIGFDEKTGDVPAVMAAFDRLSAQGIEVVTGWTGQLTDEFDWVLVSPGLPPGHPVMSQLVGKIMGEVEFAYRIAMAPMLAITGTNGKSTTTVMLYKCLQDHGAVLCGNISGSGYPEHVLTEAALKTPADGVLIAEISSAQLETVISFRPDVAALTNITEDHLDRYKTFDEYRSAKLNMFKNMTCNQVCVLNLNEPSLQRDWAKNASIVGFSPEGGLVEHAQTRRIDDSLWLSGHEVKLTELPFVGEMNYANAMMAWEMACAFIGTPDAGMFRRLLEFKPLSNRLEPLGERNGVRIINNSMCTNPVAVVQSCKSFRQKLHVLMGGNTKNMDFAPLRDYLQVSGQKVYLYGSDAGILNNLLGGKLDEYPTLEIAFKKATQNATAGEIILLAPGCSSSGPFANFRERGDAFRKVAKEWLEDETDDK